MNSEYGPVDLTGLEPDKLRSEDISELEKCRAELKDTYQERDEITMGSHATLDAWDKERKHRKWALKEMKDKQRLWRNYCGVITEEMNKLEECKTKLEQCRDENGRVAEKLLVQVNEITNLEQMEAIALQDTIERAEKAEAENKELNALFDMQQKRTKRAEKMWQEATGKHNTLPGLGELLDWLMAENDKTKWLKHLWRQELAEVKKQKNHRKWALQCDEDCKYHYKRAKQFKTKIGKLLAILDKHGIVHG